MRYKTLARLGVRLLGVYFIGMGLGHIVQSFVWVLSTVFGPGMGGISGPALWRYFSMFGPPVGYLAVGCYLFFDGTWVVDRIIPSNRPYCPECSYELTGLVGGRCPECGTPLPPGLVPQTPVPREIDGPS